MSWRQSNASILVITKMALWRHAGYGRPEFTHCSRIVSVMYKGYCFVLLIWHCLDIRYQVDVILRTATVEGFATSVFLLKKDLNYLWNSPHKIFLVICFINVLQMPIVDTATTLYVVCKYSFALSLYSRFLCIFPCILPKCQH